MKNVKDPRRHLAVQGATNIRDIGGYAIYDGRAIRWKTILRADEIEYLRRELVV